MSASSGSPGRDSRHLAQQHKLAKDLIRAARAGDAAAIARLAAAFPGRPRFRLADAQLVVARDAGFDSWNKLVARVEQQELSAMRDAVRAGDAERLRRLLANSAFLRRQVNAPLFEFGQRPLHAAASRAAVVDVLMDYGADPDLKSDWQNGPYTPLDNAADDAAVRHLLGRGATLTPNVAARLGWIDELREMLDADPSLVHARGGDGKQPLHEAKTVEVADLLIGRGADLDARCIDHASTPAQYALVERPEVCRRLLERGAKPDVFIAARLGDAALAERLIAADAACAGARIHLDGYPAVPPNTIYCWTLGWYKSPGVVAAEAGQAQVAALIARHADPRTRLLDAVFLGDEAAARAVVAAHPDVVSTLRRHEHALLGHAAHLRMDDAFKLMLSLGFDPLEPALDGGTALHQAAWTGAVELIELLLKSREWDLETPDPTHHSTPLGWVAHGANHCRHPRADYPRSAELLIRAGARHDTPDRGSYSDLIKSVAARVAAG